MLLINAKDVTLVEIINENEKLSDLGRVRLKFSSAGDIYGKDLSSSGYASVGNEGGFALIIQDKKIQIPDYRSTKGLFNHKVKVFNSPQETSAHEEIGHILGTLLTPNGGIANNRAAT